MEKRFVPWEKVDEACRLYARTQNYELSSNKYKTYLVTANQVDITKKNTVTAEWSAVVVAPTPLMSYETGVISI